MTSLNATEEVKSKRVKTPAGWLCSKGLHWALGLVRIPLSLFTPHALYSSRPKRVP
ncbi:hypothetical protein FA13DRAFT_1738375 [Coprinellus micaceus]|uniref:Uncharacterized protein n=1 Tax=Coprinellus micaceus TaxID=71717 RepID=A0A4Y7SU84_COPMI|nr:hypothetical protein FA13DRAFT_1738375 [Coprinellus micaceus]